MLEEAVNERNHFVLVVLSLACMASLTVCHKPVPGHVSLPVLLRFSYANSAPFNYPSWEKTNISIFIFLLYPNSLWSSVQIQFLLPLPVNDLFDYQWLQVSLLPVKLLMLNCYHTVRQDSCSSTQTHICGSLQALDWGWQAVSQEWFGWGRLTPNLGFVGYSLSFVFCKDMRLLQLGSHKALLSPKCKLLWDRLYLRLLVVPYVLLIVVATWPTSARDHSSVFLVWYGNSYNESVWNK